MPTVIDALVVELGFDVEGMESGRKKVEDAFRKTSEGAANVGKKIDDTAKRSEIFLTKLRNNVLALFAAFTAGKGIKQFVADVTASDAALGRLAATMDMSAHTLASWRAAGELMGVSAADIDGTFQNLNSDLQNFALTGKSNLVPWLRQMQIQVTDLHGKMLPLDNMLLQLADHFKGRDKAQSAAIMAQMGITPGGIQLILAGRDAIQKYLEISKPLADAQERDIEAAQKRQLAWNRLKSQWEAVGITILTKLTPALNAVVDALAAIGKWFDEHPEAAGAVFAALTGVVIALSIAMGALAFSSGLATIIGGFTALSGLASGMALGLAVLAESLFPALAEALFSVALAIEATPIGWIITGIAALSIGVYELWKHLDDVKRIWNELTPAWLHFGKEDKKGAQKGSGAPGGAGGRSPSANAEAKAMGALRHFEGFQGNAKWDINAYRAGYGSDTVTDPVTGKVSKVNSGTRVTKEMAEADLARRVGITSNQAQTAIGSAWNKLSDDARAAIISTSYNYGRTPKSVVAAAQTGDNAKVAAAIQGLRGQNGGMNANRRDAEAKMALSGPTSGAGGGSTAGAVSKALAKAPAPGVLSGAQGTAMASNTANDNRATTTITQSETKIANLNVYSAAKDAAPMAGDIRRALARDKFVQQANSGPA